MKTFITITILSLALFVFGGCEQSNPESTKSEPRAGEIDGRGEDLPKAEENKPKEETKKVEGEMTFPELLGQYNEDKEKLKGKEIIISGEYKGTTVVETDGKKKIMVSVQQKNGISGIDCVVKEKPVGKESFSNIKVKGKLSEQDLLDLVFDPCEIIE